MADVFTAGSARPYRGIAVAMGLLTWALVACGEATLVRPLPPLGHGRFKVELESTAHPELRALTVTVGRVTAWSDALGWVTLSRRPATVDVLALEAGALDLGFADLPEGEIGQLRLYLEAGETAVAVLSSGASMPVELPASARAGIKIDGPFVLDECAERRVTLRFDAERSLVATGGSGALVLRPVVRAQGESRRQLGCTSGGASGSGEVERNPSDDSSLGRGTSGGGSSVTQSNGSSSGSSTTTSGSSSTSGGASQTNTMTGSTSDAGTASGPVSVEEASKNPGRPAASTGHAPPASLGDGCAAGSDCLSGVCEAGHCALSGAGAACASSRDCASQSCVKGQCAAGSAMPSGWTCENDVSCMSGSCESGACMPGLQGAYCAADGDCELGLTCAGGACSPTLD